jgi:hypothetical protein
MQPDLTRLSLGTGDVQPATPSMYNGGAPRSSQYTPRQMTVRDITKDFSDASASTLMSAPAPYIIVFFIPWKPHMGCAERFYGLLI